MPKSPECPDVDGGAERLRLDLLLWRLRFVKSRSLAQKLVARKHIRINGTRATRAHHAVRTGDRLTLAIGTQVYAIVITALPVRRGPPLEAQRCYRELHGTGDVTAEMPEPEKKNFACGRNGRVDDGASSQ